MKNENRILLNLGIAIILFNSLLAILVQPLGFAIIPICLPTATALIVLRPNGLGVLAKSLSLAGMITILDLGLKAVPAGPFDAEAQGWMHLFLFMGIIPSFIIYLFGIAREKEAGADEKWVAVLSFVGCLSLYMLLMH